MSAWHHILPVRSREMVSALKACGLDVAYCNLEADHGHDAFLLPDNRQGEVVAGFLDRISKESRR